MGTRQPQPSSHSCGPLPATRTYTPSPSNWGLIETGSASPTLEGGRRRTWDWALVIFGAAIRVFGSASAVGRELSDPQVWQLVLRARLRFLGRRYARSGGPASSVPLALDHPVEHYRAASLSPMVASSLRRALDAAQITRLGISPVSIVQYAANAEYALTGRVEAVADLLGRRSLD